MGLAAYLNGIRSWHLYLLPYVEQDNLFKAQVNHSWDANAIVKTYQAPGDPTLGSGRTWGNRPATSYAANWHVFRGGWDEDWQKGGVMRFPASITDGTSNTIFFAERYVICGQGGSATGTNYVEHGAFSDQALWAPCPPDFLIFNND